MLVRDLSTREVAVKWIAHFPYSTVVVGAVAKAERFHVPDQPVDAFGSGVAGAGTGGERGPLAASRQRPIWLPVSFHWDVANSSGTRQSELPPSMQLALVWRRRTPVENTDYAAFAGRVIRAHARRIAEGDVDGLTDLVDWPARWTLPPRLPSVDGLRGFGYPWAEIASRLGTSRQAAQQRWAGIATPVTRYRVSRAGTSSVAVG